MKIRNATIDDFDEIVQLENACFPINEAASEKDLKERLTDGDVQMILSVCTHPDYQKKGYSTTLMKQVISDCKKQNRQCIVLTCKSFLLDFYSKFGFVDEGISKSQHGGENWNQVRLTL